MRELRTSKAFDIRFSEVDSMNVVWHGSYPLYLEDAREAFGVAFGLDYQGYFNHQCYAPIAEEHIRYLHPLFYGMKPRVDIVYKPSPAAKVVFDYEIRDTRDETLIATAHSVQLFTDLNYQQLLYRPEFYIRWQEKWKVLDE